jgi:hypothetical protein
MITKINGNYEKRILLEFWLASRVVMENGGFFDDRAFTKAENDKHRLASCLVLNRFNK